MGDFVRWKDSEVPVWFPIDLRKGIVTTGRLICNTPPEGKVVGELSFSGDPIFSQPIVTFYEGCAPTQ